MTPLLKSGFDPSRFDWNWVPTAHRFCDHSISLLARDFKDLSSPDPGGPARANLFDLKNKQRLTIPGYSIELSA
jgi:hypothetical protein